MSSYNLLLAISRSGVLFMWCLHVERFFFFFLIDAPGLKMFFPPFFFLLFVGSQVIVLP